MRERSVATELRAASLRRGVDSRVGPDIGVYSFGYGFGGSARGGRRDRFARRRCAA